MTAAMCPSCHGDTTDGLLCGRCTIELTDDLTAMPEWLGYLDDALARWVQTGSGNGKRPSAQTPVPFDERASKTRAYVRNQLATWAGELNADHRHIANNPRAWCAYLIANIRAIRGHLAASEIVQEIHYCIELIQDAIDLPPSKVYLGTCEADAPDGAICDTPIYAGHDDRATVCIGCGMGYDVDTRRTEMLDKIQHQWGTIGTCAHVLNLFGVDLKSETVRSWTKARQSGDRVIPQKLHPRGQDQSGHNLYRIGDVMAVAKKTLEVVNDKRRKAVEGKARRAEKQTA